MKAVSLCDRRFSSESTAEAVIALLLEHPELLQRPILETATRAAIGRPPEDVVASFLG